MLRGVKVAARCEGSCAAGCSVAASMIPQEKWIQLMENDRRREEFERVAVHHRLGDDASVKQMVAHDPGKPFAAEGNGRPAPAS